MEIKKMKAIIKVCRMNEVLLVVPYAGTAAFLFAPEFPNICRLFFLLLAAFAGFSAGNIVNALADRDIDAQNPRTNQRPLVKNELSGREIVLLLCICMVTILVSTAVLNPYYILMLPLPVIVCFGYSICKRFTWWGHVVLGIAHGVCPVAGWMVFGDVTDWRGIVFGAVVFFWTLSLDMIYSLQDMEYDVEMGLYSIPAVFGKRVAYMISVASHLMMVLLFVIVTGSLDCGGAFIAFAIAAEMLLVGQYILILMNRQNAKYALNINQGFTLLIFVACILNKI